MTLPGQFAVGPTGAATYSVPIAVPPGTAGMAPSLSLDYSSQSGNGLLGMGWTLSGLPSIGRCPQTMAQDGVVGGINFNSNDRFCLEGQRLVAISGTYGADGAEYRTEIDSYSRILSHGTAGTGPAWFEVHTKSGQVMEFGHTADSQILAQGKTTARSWAVDKVSDSKGNYFTVTYVNDATNGQAYPSRVDYTGNAAANVATYNSVQFVYATRPDVIPQYQAGSLMQTTVRLTDVKSYADATLVADYQLAYQQSGPSNRSRITTITLCGGGGACLPATNVAWTNPTPGFGNPVSWTGPVFTVSGGWADMNTYPRMLVDMNGDGQPDIVGFSGNGVAVALNTGTSFGPAQGWTGPVFTITGGWSDMNTYPRMLVDMNGDGLPDIVGFSGNAVAVALNTGNSFGPAQGWIGPIFTITGGWPDMNTYPRMVIDVNGDGLPDVVGFSGNNINVALNTGTGSGPVQTWMAGPIFTVAGGWSDMNTFPRMLVDVNGDGLPDVVGFSGNNINVALNTGSSFGPAQTWLAGPIFTVAGGWSDMNTFPRMLVDVNGDGLPDVVGFSGNNVNVALNTGSSFGPVQTWSPYYGAANGWGNNSVVPRMLIDVNGIAAPGIVGFGGSDVVVSSNTASGPPDLVSSITNGVGVTTTISYAPSTNKSVVTKGTGTAFPTLDFIAPLYVVSRVDTTNGVGGNYGSAYVYSGGRLDTRGRGFLGFAQLSATDLQTNIVQTTTYGQSFPYIGLLGTTTKSLNTLTLNQTTNSYQFSNASGTATLSSPTVGSAPYRVSVAQSISSSSDLDGSKIPTATTNYQYDAYGNATQVAVSTPDGFSKTTANNYANDTTNWFLGRLTAASVTSVSP